MNFLEKFSIAVTLTSFLNASAQQPEEIVWTVNNFTPYMFIEGPNKGKGVIDQALQLIDTNLPEVTHLYTPALIERSLEMMKTQPNVCNGALLRTPEREKIIDFTTHPIVWILPNGIITTRDRRDGLKPYMNEKRELQLDQVLASGKYRLYVDQVRTYGPHIDGILREPALQNSILRSKNAVTPESRLLKLVNQKDYDLVIGYAVELKGATMNAGTRLNEEEFAFIPIAGEPPLRSIPAACSKSETGRRFIAALDKLLAKPAIQKEIAQHYRQWLDAETAQRYDQLLKQATASPAAK